MFVLVLQYIKNEFTEDKHAHIRVHTYIYIRSCVWQHVRMFTYAVCATGLTSWLTLREQNIASTLPATMSDESETLAMNT